MNHSMQNLIKNDWQRKDGEPFAIANILHHEIHPEGLDVNRFRFVEDGSLLLDPELGYILSILQGEGEIHLRGDPRQCFNISKGIHCYIPPWSECIVDVKNGTEILCVSSECASQARGKRFLLRDETFLAACAVHSQSLRWIFTPQYISRRIFLHHDPVLLSKSGNPISWFHTTMFDVTGLPQNQDGEPVFKMSYNSRTEFNVCYDVKGDARVRMAQHPYNNVCQNWKPWLLLDGDSTYHLNEAAGCPQEEQYFDELSQTTRFFRNKHEVYIADGYVTLFCLFDPAPAGIERHQPGEYSDYEPLSKLIGTESYEIFQREILRYDEMVDKLSLAKAMGRLDDYHGSPLWDLYLQGRDAQIGIELDLANKLIVEGKGREHVLAEWMQSISAK